MSSRFARLDKGSLVLVTGGTGFIGSAVTTLLLDRGFKVRIATRSVEKQQPFRDHLQGKYGKDHVEFIEVDDYASPEAWSRMLQGVAGVQHLASDVSFSNDYDSVINSSRAMTMTFLDTVNKHKSVKSVVLTSSRIAAYHPQYGSDVNATKHDWTDYFLDLAKNAQDDDPAKGMLTYAASKVVEERVAWEIVERTKPNFAFNVILPDYVAGPVLNPSPGQYSTHGWLNEIFVDGNLDGLAGQTFRPCARWVDVRDVATIHVAAMLDGSADRQRLFAAPHKFTLNAILAAWREAFPGRKIVEDVNWGKQPEVNVDDEESTALLQEFTGQGWIPFEQTAVDNVQDVA